MYLIWKVWVIFKFYDNNYNINKLKLFLYKLGAFRGADMRTYPIVTNLNVLDVIDRIKDILREWISPETISN